MNLLVNVSAAGLSIGLEAGEDLLEDIKTAIKYRIRRSQLIPLVGRI